jgi:hypothetical protein
VEAFAPVLLEPRLPRVVLLDDIPFTVKSSLFGGPFGVAFCVCGALAHERGNSKLLRLSAYQTGGPQSRTRAGASADSLRAYSSPGTVNLKLCCARRQLK